MEGKIREKGVNQNRPLVNLVEYSKSHGGKWSPMLVAATVLSVVTIDNKIKNRNTEDLLLIGDLLASTTEGSSEAKWVGKWIQRYEKTVGYDDLNYLTCLLENIHKIDQGMAVNVLDYIDNNPELVELRSEGTKRLSLALWKIRVVDGAGMALSRNNTDDINVSRLRLGLTKDENSQEEVIRNTLDNYRGVDRQTTLFRLTTLVASLGIDVKMANDVASSWMSYRWEDEDLKVVGEDRFLKHCGRNMATMQNIIKAKGIEGLNILYGDYGITHFGRYPEEILIDQLEERNKPYGIWLGPYSDYNGAFYQDKNKIEKLEREAGNLGLGIKIIEARDRLSIVRRLKKLNSNFGNKNKIAYVVVSGHGDPRSVQIGSEKDDKLTADDLKKQSAKDLRSVYADNVAFLFNSCSTGQGRDNISNRYSVYGDGYSVGPDFPGYLEWIHLGRDTSGHLYFEVGYGGDKKKVTASIFKAGANAAAELEQEKRKRYKDIDKAMINMPFVMEQLWETGGNESFSILLRILNREKLAPLKEILRLRFGEKRVGLSFGLKKTDGSIVSPATRVKTVSLAVDDFDQGFGPSVNEDFGRLSKLAYVNLQGRNDVIPFAVVDGEMFEIDIRDLYPENIGIVKKVEDEQ